MKALKIILVLGLVFLAGVAVGVGGTQFAVKKIVAQATQQPEWLRERMERDLQRELRLTPEQRRKVSDVLVRGQEELQTLRKDFRPRLGMVLKRGEREIRAVLNEEQREKFDQMMKRRPPVPLPQMQALPAK